MVKKLEHSTPAGSDTPWKGRLRSHHATPPSLPSPRLPSSAKKRQGAQPAQSFKKRAAGKNAKNTGKCGSQSEGAEEKRPPSAPRRSLRLAGNLTSSVDDLCKDPKVRGNQPTITSLRSSLRLCSKDKNSNEQLHEVLCYQKQLQLPLISQGSAHDQFNQNTISMYQNHENSSKISGSNTVLKPFEKNKDLQKLCCQGSHDIPPRTKVPNLSRKQSEKEDVNSSCWEKLAGKRKRGTEGRSSSKRQNHQDHKSLPPECQELAPSNKTRNPKYKKSENNSSSMSQPKYCDERLMNAKRNKEELDGNERGEILQRYSLQNWTEEQDMALHKAYFTARPSPNFWKKVSKMVPGKSAEECLSRVHADLSTPSPITRRRRTSNMNCSPLGHFTLSDPKHPNILEPNFRRITAKQKSLAAQKTVRHLLKKHCLTDQTQVADHFSIFEKSPTVLPLNISFQDSPGTPDSSWKKPLAKLKTVKDVSINSAEPSPAVLKPVKNAILHEKYVDRLSRREGTKQPCKNAAGSKNQDSAKALLSEQQTGGMKAARNALISEATDFISHFKKMQANSLAHVVEDNEDDEINGIECDTINHCDHK
ncbi:hypothetical protein GUJ93_ZPchr0004g38810 [Zizania palustris]|uniref:Myb-like domain-containing protein n=1 Tax=Zizania palustris TaxID=103762 RepID=A0A8J5SIH7_ZIZPA|nr:hypothetical protein GUJ93_ZPchr0004g38810 [Zizania palustris]KAG8064404.1 hypothetical protein GUJ93_ZPchr0004g38810 [Zizania palustris]KAG8064405.1 hypothetical protein GUJ93_ZPchr0004g38810 [Zizania palustris]KAG8064406.1 hypothetical protein GUJ93_ZPchr0004g38810 [Zizania palustris]